MHRQIGRRQAARVLLPRLAPGSAPAAKAVAVTRAAGRSSAIAVSTKASDLASFRLATKTGTGLMPFATSAAHSASIGATSSASSIER
jgi:hypothetical protein